MRNILFALLLVELLASLFHGWQMSLLHGWQLAGAQLISHSPDASANYSRIIVSMNAARGFLEGLLVGAIAIAIILVRSLTLAQLHRAWIFAIIGLPLIGILIPMMVF